MKHLVYHDIWHYSSFHGIMSKWRRLHFPFSYHFFLQYRGFKCNLAFLKLVCKYVKFLMRHPVLRFFREISKKPCWTKEIHSIFFSKSRNSFRHFCVYLRLVPLLEKKKFLCLIRDFNCHLGEKNTKIPQKSSSPSNWRKKIFQEENQILNFLNLVNNFGEKTSWTQHWQKKTHLPTMMMMSTFCLSFSRYFRFSIGKHQFFVTLLQCCQLGIFFCFFLWFCNFSLNLKVTISFSFEGGQKLNMSELKAQIIVNIFNF